MARYVRFTIVYKSDQEEEQLRKDARAVLVVLGGYDRVEKLKIEKNEGVIVRV